MAETAINRDSVQVLGTPTDGQVPTWDATQSEWVPETPAGGSVDAFKTIAVSGQSDVVADSSTDTLTLVAGSNVTITTDAATDSITIAATAAAAGSFGTVQVSGQSDVVAEVSEDALTLAGSGIAITTNATTDTITFQREALTGDVTASAGSNATTIASNAVKMSQLADIATDRIIGRDTAGTGDPESLTVGGGIEFTGAGGIQRSALAGDVTASAGSTATTIANDAVTYAKMQNVSATDKVLGRATAGAGDVEEISCTAAGRALIDDADAAAQRATLGLGTVATESTVPIAKGGTGQTTQTAAMDALSPTTTKGDLLADNGTNVVRLAVGTDGYALQADSTASAGVAWKVPHGHKLTATYDSAEVNNTTAETNLLNYTLPANTLGATGGVDVVIRGYMKNTVGSDRGFTAKVYWGGAVVWQDAGTATSNAQYRPFEIRFRIQNLNATNKQSVLGLVAAMSNLTGSTTGLGNFGATDWQNVFCAGTAGGAAGTKAVDTTADADIRVSFTMAAAASASVGFKVDYAEVRYAA